MSNKAFALAAFNTAVIATNAAHAAKRGVVAAASFTKDTATSGAVNTKEAGVAFWAGMKYAHQYNKANAVAAERLTPEDVEASKPSTKSAKTRTVSKAKAAARSAK